MKIILNNNELLKTKCQKTELKNGKVIAKRMWQFLNKYNKKNKVKAVGLAANQFGINASVAIVLKNNCPFILINPKIISYSELKIRNEEGCLSYPDIRLDVYRHIWVEVTCDNHSGSIFFGDPSLRGDLRSNLESAVAQHEIAHLHGLTFHDFQWENSLLPKEW